MTRAIARPHGRPAFLLIDAVMAAAVLGIVLAIAAYFIARMSAERRALDRRQFAVVAAENVLERVSRQPYDELTDASLAREAVDPITARVLVDPILTLGVEESAPDEPPGRWIRVELRWPGMGGVLERPVRLATWRARLEGAHP